MSRTASSGPHRPLKASKPLNEALRLFCLESLKRASKQHSETVLERFEQECAAAALRPLPDSLPDPCASEYARVNRFAEVTVGTNRYSVPWRNTGRDAVVDVYDDKIVIHVDGAIVAQHLRAVGKHQDVIDPLHLIDLIAYKHRAALTASAFSNGRIPQPLVALRDRLLERDGAMATKTWTTILLLAKESSLEALASATEITLSRGTLDPHAIALLLRQRGELPATADPRLRRSTPGGRAQVVDLDAYRMSGLVEKSS